MNRIETLALWIGSVADARDFQALFVNEVCAIVQLAADEPAIAFPRELISLRIPLVDGSGNAPELLRLAIVSVASLIESGSATLVCCSAGMSRSPAIVAAALARLNRGSLDDCLKLVTSSHPADVHPALWQEIRICVESSAADKDEGTDDYSGHRWIKVPRYVLDESKSWEDRYAQFEQHHLAETTFLIGQVRELAAKLNSRIASRTVHREPK